jgi:putative salt-induced outer membrane protein YdiY
MLPFTLLLALVPSASAPVEALTCPDPFLAAAQDAVPAPGESKWTGAVAVGIIATDGNTETTTATATADAEYRRAKDRTTAGLWWNYQSDQNVAAGSSVIQRKSGIKGKYDYFFSKKTYGLVQASLENDLQADIDLRTTVGAGLGRQFREDENFKLSGELGLSWFQEQFRSSPDDDYLAARAAYNVDYKPNKKWNFLHSAEYFPSLEDTDDIYIRLDSKARATLTEKMFAQLQWVFDWDNTPAPGKERADNRYMLSLGWTF